MEVWDLWLLEGGKHIYSLVFVRIFNCLQMIWVLETLSQYPARCFSTESALETLEAQNHPNSSWMNWRTHSKSFNTRNKNKTVKRFWNMFWTCSIICTMNFSVTLEHLSTTLELPHAFTVSNLIGLHAREPRQTPLILVCIAVELRNKELRNTSRLSAGNPVKSTFTEQKSLRITTTGTWKKPDISPSAFVVSILGWGFCLEKGHPCLDQTIGIFKASIRKKIIKPQAPLRLEQSSCTNKLFRNSCTPWCLNISWRFTKKKKTNCFRKLFSPVNMFTFQPLPVCNRSLGSTEVWGTHRRCNVALVQTKSWITTKVATETENQLMVKSITFNYILVINHQCALYITLLIRNVICYQYHFNDRGYHNEQPPKFSETVPSCPRNPPQPMSSFCLSSPWRSWMNSTAGWIIRYALHPTYCWWKESCTTNDL